MDRFGLDWYRKEEEKRKKQREAYDITMINRQLQHLLHEVQNGIDDWKAYEDVANRLERQYRVVQSSLWRLSWANNFENPQVALAQALLIVHILKNESLEREAYYYREVDRFMRGIANIDRNSYVTYMQQKTRI